MSKENNLTDFLTDVADAIREKKGTGEKINPQNFSDEIKGIKTSSSFWTGHVDVEGLKAIGWDDEDIAYFQEHGVNWMEEDDEYHKVLEDNKALYGVINYSNYKDYKDIIVYLPKFDMSADVGVNTFAGFNQMVGIPILNMTNIEQMYYTFDSCYMLTCIPPLDVSNSKRMYRTFNNCHSLMYVPPLETSKVNDFTRCFYACYSMRKLPAMKYVSATTITGILNNDYSLEVVEILDAESLNVNPFGSVTTSLKTVKIANLNTSIAFSGAPSLSKESILYMIEHEAATAAITITLHAVSYERLATDPDIVAALENHPNVSLASA